MVYAIGLGNVFAYRQVVKIGSNRIVALGTFSQGLAHRRNNQRAYYFER